MSGCCGPCCSKTFVVLYNIIFWISGCALVGGGVYVLYDMGYTHLYTLFNLNPEKYPVDYFFYGAYAIIGLGGLVLFVGFFGCCGVLQESKCMLGMYIFFLILICFVEAVIALGVVYCHFSTPSDVRTKLKETLTNKYNVLPEYENITVAIDYAQANFKCCGITGARDHEDIRADRSRNSPPPPNYPLTCCILSDEFQAEDIWLKPNPINRDGCQDQAATSSRNTEGCWKKLETWLFLHVVIIAGTSGGLAILQIFGVLFSLCLIRNIGEEV